MMKLVICMLIFIAAVSAQNICCFPAGETTCTPGIDQALCIRTGGSVTGPIGETCCCFGANAGPYDHCLPGVATATCLGQSVGGRCKGTAPPVLDRCCCTPASLVGVNDANCINRIPRAMCEKAAGAQCYLAPGATKAPTSLAPTPVGGVPSCSCRIQRASGPVTLTLALTVCAKFNGACVTSVPTPAPTVNTKCCCIFDGATYPSGVAVLPSDPMSPVSLGLCIADTEVSQCNDHRKRVGACWTGASSAPTSLAPTPSPTSPTCVCVDPDNTSQNIKAADGTDALIQIHVCTQKLQSTCFVPTCCCTYPSAASGDPCVTVTPFQCAKIPGATCA